MTTIGGPAVVVYRFSMMEISTLVIESTGKAAAWRAEVCTNTAEEEKE